MQDSKIGFVGAGNMATALIRGLLGAKASTPANIQASDVDAARTTALARELGIGVASNNTALAEWADILILAVKPQAMAGALRSFAHHFDRQKLLISIAAGTTSKSIEDAFEVAARVVRAMPNTPALVGAGATAVSRGKHATAEDMKTSIAIFSCVGLCIEVEETKMDAVTGLSGSGPAYVMLAIEALADGGVQAGLPRDVALVLATQTVLGSAQLVLTTKEHPAVLKDKVTSPGGTTIAGILELERAGFRSALIRAVVAATNRSAELGR